jgi:uncharacterized protein YdaU (DUF1376 family)
MNPPKMPIHIGDLMRDTGHLRALLFGAYLALLFHHWSTGLLPDDDEQLSAIARMSPAEWRKARPIIEKFFQPGWVHGRVVDDLADAKESYEKLASAGSKGGKARAENKRRLSEAISIATSDVQASLNQPLTFNQGKKDAAIAAPDPEVELFRRGKEVLGKSAGGLVKQLLDAKGGKINLARAAIETASSKENPREYIGKIISNQIPPHGEVSRFVDGRL